MAVLALASDMMSFGFFSSKGKIYDLCKPLLSVLDGRPDYRITNDDDGDNQLNRRAKDQTSSKRFSFLPSDSKAKISERLSFLPSSSRPAMDPKTSKLELNPMHSGGSGLDMRERALTETQEMRESAGTGKGASTMGGFADVAGSIMGETKLANVAGSIMSETKSMNFKEKVLVSAALERRKKTGKDRWVADVDTLRVMKCKINTVRASEASANIRETATVCGRSGVT